MDMETIIATGILVFWLVCVLLHILFENKSVRFTYHDQKVVVKEKRGEKKNG